MRINEFSKTNFKNVAVKQAKPVLKRFQSSSINQANLESSFAQNISPQTSLINFTRKWKEHNSWGAVVNPETKDVTFKLFTFPDAKSVKAVVIKKDSERILEKINDINKNYLHWYEVLVSCLIALIGYRGPNLLLIFQLKMRKLEMEKLFVHYLEE